MEKKLNNLLDVTKKLLHLDVSKYVEEKNKLKYLSWANAIKEALKIDPEFEYSIIKNEDGIPIFGNGKLGYMVYTTVTFQGKTRECWLPVMDGANKPMKNELYTYKGNDWQYCEQKKKKIKVKVDKPVEALSMFDINKAIMRCLTKNLAMFGLGLYIYSGEDLPEEEINYISDSQLKLMNTLISKLYEIKEEADEYKNKLRSYYKVETTKDLTDKQADDCIKKINIALKK